MAAPKRSMLGQRLCEARLKGAQCLVHIATLFWPQHLPHVKRLGLELVDGHEVPFRILHYEWLPNVRGG